MKKILFAALLFLSAVLSPFSGTQAEQAADPAAQEEQKKEQYEKSMEERFRKLGKSLDELKSRAGTIAEQTRKDMDRHLAEAEKKRKIAARKIEDMKTESRKKWSKFTDELNAAMDEFEKAYERAKAHFKE